MKKEKTKSNSHEKLIRLASCTTPEEYQKLLNDIDEVIFNTTDLKPNDLPWLNPDKHDENWEKTIREIRLMIGRIAHEFEKSKRDRVLH